MGAFELENIQRFKVWLKAVDTEMREILPTMVSIVHHSLVAIKDIALHLGLFFILIYGLVLAVEKLIDADSTAKASQPRMEVTPVPPQAKQ